MIRSLDVRMMSVEQGRVTVDDRDEWRAVVNAIIVMLLDSLDGRSHASVPMRNDQIWSRKRDSMYHDVNQCLLLSHDAESSGLC